MRRVVFLVGLISAFLAVAVQANAQASPQPSRFQVFAGYSYERGEAVVNEVPLCLPAGCALPSFEKTDRGNLNGWDATAAYHILPWFSIAANFTGHYGSFYDKNAPDRSKLSMQSYMGGPQLNYPARFSPFIHLFVGEASEKITPPQSTSASGGPVATYSVTAASYNSVAEMLGGGVDYHLSQHIDLRLAEVDYLFTRFHSGIQTQPLISAGVVLRF